MNMNKILKKLVGNDAQPINQVAISLHVAHRGPGNAVWSDLGCNYSLYVVYNSEAVAGISEDGYRDAGEAGMTCPDRKSISPAAVIRHLK